MDWRWSVAIITSDVTLDGEHLLTWLRHLLLVLAKQGLYELLQSLARLSLLFQAGLHHVELLVDMALFELVNDVSLHVLVGRLLTNQCSLRQRDPASKRLQAVVPFTTLVVAATARASYQIVATQSPHTRG